MIAFERQITVLLPMPASFTEVITARLQALTGGWKRDTRDEAVNEALVRVSGTAGKTSRLFEIAEMAAADTSSAGEPGVGPPADPIAVRLFGIVRVVAQSEEQVAPLFARAFRLLVETFDEKYLITVLTNRRIDEKKREDRFATPNVPDGGDPDVWLEMIAAHKRQGKGAGGPSLEEVEERLRIIFSDTRGIHREHELVCFGYHKYAGYSHQRVIGELAPVPLEVAAWGVREHAVSMYGIPRSRLGSVMPILLAVRSKDPLESFWANPVSRVKEWVRAEGETVTEPGLRGLEKRMESKGANWPGVNPHHLLAYLMASELGYSAERIVAVGSFSLEAADALVVESLGERAPKDVSRIQTALAALKGKNKGRKRFGEAWDPAETLSNWTANVFDRYERACLAQARGGFRAILSIPSWEPCEMIAFLFAVCLGEGVDRVSRHLMDEQARTLVARLTSRIMSKWKAEPASVEEWLSRLIDRTAQLPNGITLARGLDVTSGELLAAVSAARDKIQRQLPRSIGREFPLFARLHGLGVKS